MSIQLPARENYYRPTRGRELRRRAAQLDASAWCLTAVARLAYVCGLLATVVSYVSYVSYAHPGLFATAAGLLLWAELAGGVALILQAAVGRLKAQADRLEAEHRARYGGRSRRETE